MNTATQTRIGTRLRPSVTSPIGFPSTGSHTDPAAACDGFTWVPQDWHTIRLTTTVNRR